MTDAQGQWPGDDDVDAAARLYADEDGVTWSRPTAFAYAAACRALRARPRPADRLVKDAREKAIRDVAALVDEVLAMPWFDRRDSDGAQVFAARMKNQIKALLATPTDGAPDHG